ncbi:MAG: ribose-phosphate diphosphokinase [Candidatus Aenigmarchaeota archaeon]|nr:ribose-phosphate diphosphokinase [Candidatus Aenigmarchaeota archaeon]
MSNKVIVYDFNDRPIGYINSLMPEMAIVSDYSGESFARKVTNRINALEKEEAAGPVYNDFHHVTTNIRYFSDGEPDIQIKENIRGRAVFYVCSFQPDPMKRLAEIKFISSTLKDSSAAKVVVVPTYLGFMKKDWKDKPRVPISIRVVAETLEPYADTFLTIDMHSPQIQGMFRKPLDHLDGTVLIANHIRHNDYGSDLALVENHDYDVDEFTVVSPDIGGLKRVKKLAERLGLKNPEDDADNRRLAAVYKLRDPVTGKIVGGGIVGKENIKDRHVILLDDQVISGESVVKAAEMVTEVGAKSVHAYATHGLMTVKDGIPAEHRIADSLIQKLYITDTVARSMEYFDANPKIELISCTDLFAEAIRRIYYNKSLSELFR